MDLRFAHMHKQFSHIIRSFESISLCDSFAHCSYALLAIERLEGETLYLTGGVQVRRCARVSRSIER
jgi:hypothetical protein